MSNIYGNIYGNITVTFKNMLLMALNNENTHTVTCYSDVTVMLLICYRICYSVNALIYIYITKKSNIFNKKTLNNQLC